MAVDKDKMEEETSILRFYKIVLSWDYARLLKESQNWKNEKNAGDGPKLKEVKNTYKDVEEYMCTFEPLLFEEAKAQIVQGKDEEEANEWMKGATVDCNVVDGFWLPLVACPEAGSISQHDLLLLSSKQFGEGKRFPDAYAFALVEHRQPDRMRLRMNLSGEVQRLNTVEVRPCPRLIKMQSLVTEVPKAVFIMKISSLSTIVREYVALRSVSTLPFRDLILTAAENNDAAEDRAWKISKPLKEFIESNHNISQIEAINAGLSRRKFVLIQGPPGTGKTQTILGLLSAILHATPARMHADRGKLVEIKHGPDLTIETKYSHWAKASPWLASINPRDGLMPLDGDDGLFPKTGNELKPEHVNANRKYRVRVLVCAPSNSALDEIVLRLLNTGIRDENDRAYSPKIVRIGIKPHHSVKAVSMDHLVEQKLVGMDSQSAGDKQKQGGGGKDRDSIRASIVDEAVIVFSTLSFSGSSVFSKLNRGFDVVIIDEAAQAVEPATLVPLANGCKQVFLVGDPVQLPATVISPVAEKFGYGMSLFKRFQKAGYPVQMLKTQYRMHPEIRSFPSKEFYDEALEDGPDVLKQTKRLWHQYRCFGPFSFFDIQDGKESQPSGSGSWVNHDEVEFILVMYNKLVTRYPELKSSARLAIISPYRQQVKLFRDKFQETFGVESEKLVDINTVDGFQGREKDVAIFSCVRSSKDKGIGFVADFRRMNVGITRARSSVLVVGSASTLKRDKHWKNLVESAESRDGLIKVSKPYNEFFSDSNLKTYEVKESMPENGEAPPEAMDVDVSALGITADAAEPGPVEHDGGSDGEGFDVDDD